MGEIYAFYDIRYVDSIKIGSGAASAYLNGRAQGYSPTGIACKARWYIQDDASRIEHQIHDALKGKKLVLPNRGNPWRGITEQRNGNEWFLIEISDSTAVVESILGDLKIHYRRLSEVLPSNRRKDFLQSAPSFADGKATYPGRLVLWIMEECFTGRIKVYQCSEWYSPLETIRTYSRNGFYPLGYTTYAGAISLEANTRLDSLRKQTLDHFGVPPGRQNFGWLVDGVQHVDVTKFIEHAGRGFLDPWNPLSASAPVRPSGVRTGQALTTIPANERGAFDPRCEWSSVIIRDLSRA